MNLAECLERTASRLPDKAALRTDTDRELSFRELDDLAGRLAGGLADRGVARGDRVAVMGGSHPEFVATFFAAWKLGAIAVAVNAQLGPDEVRHQLANSGARLAVADAGRCREVIDEAASGVASLEHVVVMGEALGRPVRAVDLDGAVDATIFYTSGTTGVPKGAVHTHRSLATEVEYVGRHYSITEEDVYLSVLPIYLLSIFVLGPLSSILRGATCRLMSRYHPWDYARAVVADRTTILPATIPMMFADLLDLPPEQAAEVDLSTVRIASCGGSPMPADVRREFEERFNFRFVHAYGGTEGPALMTCDPVDAERRFDSVGLPLPHIRVTIEDDAGRELSPGEVGEVRLGPQPDGPHRGRYEPMRCYWGLPEESAKAVRDGKLTLGDVGYLDDDGYLYLVDRKKDMIIRGGMNVYPKELEDILYQDPRVTACAVVGAPHRRYGEVPFAIVQPAPGTEMTAEDVLAQVNDRVARFKHLWGARIVDGFPRNALGKIVKSQLRGTVSEADVSEPTARQAASTPPSTGTTAPET